MRKFGIVVVRLLWALVFTVATGMLFALGPARLANPGFSFWAILAAFALPLVVALLVLGALRNAKHWWSRVIMWGVGVPLVAFIAVPVGLGTYATHPSPAPLGVNAPGWAVEVSMPLSDDEDDGSLSAWYMPTSDGAAVVLAHPAGTNRVGVLSEALKLYDAGYGVLMLDARGHGDSAGEANEVGWWGESDLDLAVTALLDQPGVDPSRVGIVGVGMGGASALGAARGDDRVAAIVAEEATPRVAADRAGWLSPGPRAWAQTGMDMIQQAVVGLFTTAPQPETLRESTQASSIPTLIVTPASSADQRRAAEWLAADDPDVTTWESPATPDSSAVERDPAAWTDNVIGFLDSALAG